MHTTMTSARHLLLFALAFGFTSALSGYGIPQTFGNNTASPVKLLGDGSVVIKPGEKITLAYEVEDGQIATLKRFAGNKPEAKNVLTIELTRTGGVATSLGPTSPITDTLTIRSGEKSITARCEYKLKDLPQPEHSRITGTTGVVSKSFRWGVSQVTVSEIQFRKP